MCIKNNNFFFRHLVCDATPRLWCDTPMATNELRHFDWDISIETFRLRHFDWDILIENILIEDILIGDISIGDIWLKTFEYE